MIGDVCDQVWMLNRGSVRFHGTTHQLRQSFPAAESLEQAFFAAMNEHPMLDPEPTESATDKRELAAIG